MLHITDELLVEEAVAWLGLQSSTGCVWPGEQQEEWLEEQQWQLQEE